MPDAGPRSVAYVLNYQIITSDGATAAPMPRTRSLAAPAVTQPAITAHALRHSQAVLHAPGSLSPRKTGKKAQPRY
jgi:hypothetical protein